MKNKVLKFGILVIVVGFLSACTKGNGSAPLDAQNPGLGLRDPQGCVLNSNWISPQELVSRKVVEVEFCRNGECETRQINRDYHPYALNNKVLTDLATAGQLPTGEIDELNIELSDGDVITEDFSENVVTIAPTIPAVCLQAKRQGNSYQLNAHEYKSKPGFTILDAVN